MPDLAGDCVLFLFPFSFERLQQSSASFCNSKQSLYLACAATYQQQQQQHKLEWYLRSENQHHTDVMDEDNVSVGVSMLRLLRPVLWLRTTLMMVVCKERTGCGLWMWQEKGANAVSYHRPDMASFSQHLMMDGKTLLYFGSNGQSVEESQTGTLVQQQSHLYHAASPGGRRI
jgi:hypothetical protein